MSTDRSDPSCDPPAAPRRKNIPIVRLQMVREGRFPYSPGAVRTSADAARIFQSYLEGADREHFLALMLDQKNRVNALNVVSIGSLTTAIVHPREAFKPAVIANAASIIFAHNHPSGDPHPSREDEEMTKRLNEAGEILGIKVLDHIVVGEGQYFSFGDQGRLPRWKEGSWQMKT